MIESRVMIESRYDILFLFIEYPPPPMHFQHSAFSTLRIFNTPQFQHSAFSTLRIFNTPHFQHSAFSTLRIFNTPHFQHSALSTLRIFNTPGLRTPGLRHSAYSRKPVYYMFSCTRLLNHTILFLSILLSLSKMSIS